MDLQINTKNIELNSQSEDYIRKKFDRLARHLRPLSDAKVEISRTSAKSKSERIVAQVTLSTNSYTLRGQERGPNLYAAIDAVTAVVDRQIHRFKGKVYRTNRSRRAGKASPMQGAEQEVLQEEQVEPDPDERELPMVVRTKRFPMTPMTVEDAIVQMELLSHDFYFFHNVDTGEYNVVYRRHDGDYSVIEPSAS